MASERSLQHALTALIAKSSSIPSKMLLSYRTISLEYEFYTYCLYAASSSFERKGAVSMQTILHFGQYSPSL